MRLIRAALAAFALLAVGTSHARWYSAETGRWLEPEPTGKDGFHLYHFNFSNPANFFDPDGLAVRNYTDGTVFVRPEFPSDPNNPEWVPVPPGGEYNSPQDGVYFPCRANGPKIFKNANDIHLDICGPKTDPCVDCDAPAYYMNDWFLGPPMWGITHLSNCILGGWKGPEFVKEHPEWKPPQPSSCECK